VRRIELPAPMRDARVLRTLILLDLESHPPHAGIDRVGVRLEPAPARIIQFSLLERAGPQPETIATLTSRLTALMGEGRVGSPVPLDSHAPDGFALTAFAPEGPRRVDRGPWSVDVGPRPVLRRFRIPVIARVTIDRDRPVHVTTDRIGIRGGAVQQFAGPWRGSGGWWVLPFTRDAEGAETQRDAEGSETQRDAEDPAATAGWQLIRRATHLVPRARLLRRYPPEIVGTISTRSPSLSGC
jgi:hypothetical protein